MKITLLAEQPEAISTIAQWYYQEWGRRLAGASEASIRDKVARKAHRRQELPVAIVAVEGERVLGVAELKMRENQQYPQYQPWLGGVFVDPASRGKGIAHLLIDRAQLMAADWGMQKLYLQCERHHIGLYEQCGFNALHGAEHTGLEVTIMLWEAEQRAGAI